MFTGGTFTCFESTTVADFALLACESVKGQCKSGVCGSFHYYTDTDALSCDCNTAPGELEWIYQNDGFTQVSMISDIYYYI